MAEWRDMESAPRDGTRVLLAMAGGDVRDGWWDSEVDLAVDQTTDRMMWRGAWVDGEFHGPDWDLVKVECEPVKWQPLPSPPETENGR